VAVSAQSTDSDLASLRHLMVEKQLRHRGIVDETLLSVMERVPRHLFVCAPQRHHAYDDAPQAIGSGQTISQPYMVARMTELLSLTSSSRVLEVGTGSGYQTAVLAELAEQVWTVERLPELARQAERLLAEQGYTNVQVVLGDGTLGLAQAAPFDAIVVTAGGPRVPAALREQLAVGGRMVIPVTAGPSQELLLVERLDDCYRESTVLRCVFVPLVGADGYQE
jgi:protein-L-isoaspartate(D-aspartate) O-methyltransferase